MTLFFADLVREVSHDAGTGDLLLGGAVPGHRGFAGTVPEGARFLYAVAGVARPEEWETGEGEIAGGRLVRSPEASSNGGQAVDFSAGLKTIALTATARWFSDQDEGGGGANGPVGIADVIGLGAALDDKAAAGHSHGGIYAAAAHGHDGVYAASGHHHDAAYAAAGHTHAGVYQPADAKLGAIAGLTGAADRVAYFTGAGTAALATLTTFGRGLIDDVDAAAGRATLGLGNAAVRTIGASGAAVPLLDGVNSWSGTQSIGGAVTLSSSGVDIAAGARLVTPSLRCEATTPVITIKDTDSAGAAMTGYFHFWDSANVPTARIGRPFGDGSLWIENEGGPIQFAMSIGIAAAQLTSGGFDLLGGRFYRVAGTQVVGPRATGWSAATGAATRTAFDTASVGVAALAERVKALIDDLRAHGLIGN